MNQGASNPGQAGVRAVRQDLRVADDQKIKRVIAMLDDVADPTVNRTLLDPLRVRLASLNLMRPLRFTRLLFLPLDPLIVEPRDWKPGEPLVPRSVLAPIGTLVRKGLGGEAIFIDKTIAKQKTDAAQAILLAGEALWPRAAEILAAAPAPSDWDESGLPVKLFEPLARAISAVLRRGVQLRNLLRDGEVGVFEFGRAMRGRHPAGHRRGISGRLRDDRTPDPVAVASCGPAAAPLHRLEPGPGGQGHGSSGDRARHRGNAVRYGER